MSQVDDTDSSVSYNPSTNWLALTGGGWYDGTYHGCRPAEGTGCSVTISFSGTSVGVYSNAFPTRGRFYCSVDGGTPWGWYSGDFNNQVGEKMAVLQCRASGLTNGHHTITYAQFPQDSAPYPISFDYYTVDTGNTGSSLTWSSDLPTLSPPSNLADTTDPVEPVAAVSPTTHTTAAAAQTPDSDSTTTNTVVQQVTVTATATATLPATVTNVATISGALVTLTSTGFSTVVTTSTGSSTSSPQLSSNISSSQLASSASATGVTALPASINPITAALGTAQPSPSDGAPASGTSSIGGGVTNPSSGDPYEPGGSSHTALIGGVVGGVVGLLLLLVVAFCCFRIRQRRKAYHLSLTSATLNNDNRSEATVPWDLHSSRDWSSVGSSSPILQRQMKLPSPSEYASPPLSPASTLRPPMSFVSRMSVPQTVTPAPTTPTAKSFLSKKSGLSNMIAELVDLTMGSFPSPPPRGLVSPTRSESPQVILEHPSNFQMRDSSLSFPSSVVASSVASSSYRKPRPPPLPPLKI